MDCKDIDKLLTAYLEGVASPEEQEQVQAHLATCSRCREEMEVRQTSRERLGRALKLTASRVTPPADAWESIAGQAGIRSSVGMPVARKFGMAWLAVPLSIFLLIVLVGSLFAGMGGMSPPPPPAPVMVSDEAGGAFLVWLDKPYYQHEAVIRVQHVDVQGNRLWGEEGLQIASGYASVSGAVSDGRGGIVVAWMSDDNISLERLDSAGKTIWTLEGFTSLSVTGMVEDDSGGVILLLYDQNDRIYTQRLSGDGVTLWEDEGVLVGTNDYPNASIAGDGRGGAVVVWQEKNGTDITIRTQRVSAEGITLWGDNGVTITSIADGQGSYQQVISDGTGNFVVAWDARSVTPDTDVYVQKLDKDGNPLWGEDGILVCQDQAAESYSPADIQSHPQIAADGAGGVIVTWHDRRRIMNREIFAQRISAAGEILWAENGVWLWNIPGDYLETTSGILDAAITADGAGGAIAVWTGYQASYTENSVIYAQRLSPDGQRLWSDEEVYRNSSIHSQGYSSIVSDGKGGVIIGSRVSNGSSVSSTDSVYAQRVDSAGNQKWGAGGLEIQRVPSSPILTVIAAVVILVAVLVLIGVFRRSRLAGIFTAIAPVLIGIAALFSNLLLIGPFGYSYSWAYILTTPINLTAVAFIPIAGLVIGSVGIWKRTVTKWVLVPVLVFNFLVTVIVELIIFTSF